MEPATVTFTGRLGALLEPLAAGQDGGRAAWQEPVALPTAASRCDGRLCAAALPRQLLPPGRQAVALRTAASRGGRRRCEEGLALQLLPHQRRAVLQGLGSLEGRAILGDEVGLGQTVEALVVARERMERGLAQTLLALVPA